MLGTRFHDRRANPTAVITAGLHSLVVGAVDLYLLRFAWADLSTGLVANAYTAGNALGFALPTHRMWDWNRVYRSMVEDECGAPTLRAGMAVVLAVQGDFYTQFPDGAAIGAQVYANPVDGSAAASPQSGFVSTPWTCMSSAQCGDWARISSWPAFN